MTWPYSTLRGVVPVAIPPHPGVTGCTVTEPVTEPVTGSVTDSDTGPVTPGVTEPGARDLGWLGTDWNDSPPGEPDPPVAGPALRRLAALFRSSELLGGGPGGLLAELAGPHPETMRQHLEHVGSHRLRPAGTAASAAFAAGHLIVTSPVKGTGKLLVLAGTVLIHAGMRLDWLGDRFARVAAFAGITAVLAFLIAQVLP
jgi:hypothetical protein